MTTPGYGCSFDECQRPVTWLITNLSNGAVISLCDEDLSVGLVPVMAANLGVDPGKLYEQVKRLVDREAAKAARAAAAPPKVPKGYVAMPPAGGADDHQADDDDHQADDDGQAADDQVKTAARK